MKFYWNRIVLSGSILLLNALSFNFVYAQEELKPIRAIIRTSFGANIALSTPEKMGMTDNLIGYDKNSFYLRFVSGTFFFSKHWGGEVTFSHNVGGKISSRRSSFNEALDRKYSDQYFITYDVYDYSYSQSDGTPGFLNVQTGPVYKFETGRIVFMARILVGVSTLETDYRYIRLKEKNSNESLDILYDTHRKNRTKSSFLISPGVNLGYRIFRRIMLTADVSYSGYKINPEYTETTTRATTGTITTKTYQYNSFVHELNLGIGASVILWQKAYNK